MFGGYYLDEDFQWRDAGGSIDDAQRLFIENILCNLMYVFIHIGFFVLYILFQGELFS